MRKQGVLWIFKVSLAEGAAAAARRQIILRVGVQDYTMASRFHELDSHPLARMAKESAERTAESALAAAAGAAARARAAMFTSYGLAIDSARSPVWVWALWRPCLVACIFLAILSRFLDRFSTAPPAPWLSSPLVFTLLYCTMLARSAPAPADARRRLEPSRLAAVERWHYALNLHQLLLNGWVCVALPLEVRALGMRAWGNRMDRSPRAYRLAWLIWVVYSNRYAQGLDTAFLLLRDKYVSVLHVFQQLALTWSWFLVCRVACGGDAYFAALMQAAYNVLTYGYFVIKRNKTPTLRAQRRITHALMLVLSVSVRAQRRPRARGAPSSPSPRAAHALPSPSRRPRAPAGAQAAHTLFVLAHGNMPRVLAVVDLLVMGSMLLLFGNFRYHKYLKPFDTVLAGERAALLQRQTSREAASGSPAPPPLAPRSKTDLGPAASRGDGPKLVVSFDSSGWLYLYHFGVCRFLQQHVLPHMPEDRCVFSGSSGGALAATALACGVPIDDLVDEILAVCWPWCRRSPFAMCPAVEYALNKFLADDGGARARAAAAPLVRARARSRVPAAGARRATACPCRRRARRSLGRVAAVLGAAAAARHARAATPAVVPRRRRLQLHLAAPAALVPARVVPHAAVWRRDALPSGRPQLLRRAVLGVVPRALAPPHEARPRAEGVGDRRSDRAPAAAARAPLVDGDAPGDGRAARAVRARVPGHAGGVS